MHPAQYMYIVFVIAIAGGFFGAAMRRAETPKTKNKFGDLMYTEAERQDEQN